MRDVHHTVFPKHAFAAFRHDRPHVRVSTRVSEAASLDTTEIHERFATRPEGLTSDEATRRLAEYGPNVLAQDQRS